MRPIDDFFAPGKRKAGAASPQNQTVMFPHVPYSLIMLLEMGSLVLES